MASATVSFIDIVEFSKLATPDQHRAIESLTARVRESVGRLLGGEDPHLRVIALPTGDGMALGFVDVDDIERSASVLRESEGGRGGDGGPPPKAADPSAQSKPICEWVLRVCHDVQSWARDVKGLQAGHPLKVRIGVHHGAVVITLDVNGRPNLYGRTVNVAQRVMDAANAQQVLFSSDAVKELWGTGEADSSASRCPLGEGGKYDFGEETPITVKHGDQVVVRPLRLKSEAGAKPPEEKWWDNSEPARRWALAFQTRESAQTDVRYLRDRWRRSKDVALVVVNGQLFRRERQLLLKSPDGFHGGNNSHPPLYYFSVRRAEAGANYEKAMDEGLAKEVPLHGGADMFSDDLRSLRVFILSRAAYNTVLKMGEPHHVEPEPHEYVKKFWETYLQNLVASKARHWREGGTGTHDSSHRPATRQPPPLVELYEFDQTAFFGYFFDWEGGNGLIHGIPYLWGLYPKDSPGFMIEWRSNPKPPAFRECCEALENMREKNANLIFSSSPPRPGAGVAEGPGAQ